MESEAEPSHHAARGRGIKTGPARGTTAPVDEQDRDHERAAIGRFSPSNRPGKVGTSMTRSGMASDPGSQEGDRPAPDQETHGLAGW